MRILASLALTIGAAALFGGCGGSQQIGQTASHQLLGDVSSTPLPGAVSQHASRPLPRYPQSSQPLLYVADDDHPFSVDIFPLTGPNQQQIGSISKGVHYPWGLSIDANSAALYVANGGSAPSLSTRTAPQARR